MNYILAIDPGNVQSGYAILSADENDITQIIESGKIQNEKLREFMKYCYNTALNGDNKPDMLAIEMIGHYGQGMAAGATTFDTCIWIGRFLETAERDMGLVEEKNIHRIMRRHEKINLCGSMKAKDKDIKQALVDRFALGQPNYGKGTKSAPGFFFGVAKDAWQAVAVGTTAFDIHIKGVKV